MTLRIPAVAALVWLQAPLQPAPTFRAETRLVVLHATVTDGRGVNASDLDASAFRIYEDGARQTITLFRRDDIPVSLGLLIDNSGSMRRIRARVEEAALAFVRASNPLDEAFVVNFADRARVDVPFMPDLDRLAPGLRVLTRSGGRR